MNVSLGEPGSPNACKVHVAPGNSFSPGVGSFGVSTRIYDHRSQRLWAPELMAAADVTWSFLYGHIPVLLSSWMADGILVESRLFVTGDNTVGDHRVYMRVRLMNARPEVARLDVLTGVRPPSASGGPIASMGMGAEGCRDRRVVVPNGSPAIISETPPTRFASDAIVHELTLDPGAVACLDFLIPVHRAHSLPDIAKDFPGVDYDACEARHIDAWQSIFDEVILRVPDARFVDACYAQIAHELMARADDAGVRAAGTSLWEGARQPERTWLSLDYLLSHHSAQGLYTWAEGPAEMLLLLRDVLIYDCETDDGLETLVLGAGVPQAWVPGYPFVGISGAPTRCGRTSWLLEGSSLIVDCERPPEGGYVIALPGGRDVSAVTDGILCVRRADGSTRVTAVPASAIGLPQHVELKITVSREVATLIP